MSWWKRIITGAATGAIENSLGKEITNSPLSEKSIGELKFLRGRLKSELDEVELELYERLNK